MKKRVKVIVDIAMFILFILLMGYHIISNEYHEILGVCLFILFIIHHILNYKWYQTLLKGKYTFTKTVFVVINILLLLGIIGIFISAILISAHVFHFLNIPTTTFGRQLHLFSTTWSFTLMGLHLGLHLKMMFGKYLKKLKNSSFEYVFYLIALLITIFGIYAFMKNRYWSDMTLLTEFKFFDYEQSPIFFYLEQLAIILSLSFLIHIIMTMINKKKILSKDSRKNNLEEGKK